MIFYNGGKHGKRYGDWDFISNCLKQLPPSVVFEVKERYSEIYVHLLEHDPHDCRRRVNSWLRKTVEKHRR